MNHLSTVPSITNLPIQINVTQPIVTASKPPISGNIMSQLLPDQTESAISTEQIVESPAPVNSTGDNKPSSDNSGMRQEIEKNTRALRCLQKAIEVQTTILSAMKTSFNEFVSFMKEENVAKKSDSKKRRTETRRVIARSEKEKIHAVKKKREKEKKHLEETEVPWTAEKIIIRGETNSQDGDKYIV